MSAIIKIDQLNKYYGNLQALKNINLEIEPGQIVGLIGLNGAGKTTLIKTILGLTRYQGDVRIFGIRPQWHRKHLMTHLCFISDVAILPRWLKVKNAIDFVEGVHPRFDRKKALHYLNQTKINLKNKIKTLSKGMIVQLHLALVMAIDADILILDEPTLGLDILYRKEFYRTILNEYFTEKRTILIATHQVEEVERLLTHLVILKEGRMLLNCPMSEYSDRFVEVTTSPENIEKLSELKPIREHKQFGRIKFIFEGVNKSQLAEWGELATPSISDVFVSKVGAAKA